MPQECGPEKKLIKACKTKYGEKEIMSLSFFYCLFGKPEKMRSNNAMTLLSLENEDLEHFHTLIKSEYIDMKRLTDN